jgi:hypothetical protein
MIYLTQAENLLLLSIGVIPFYIGIAGWSFKYYSLKANSSPIAIEDFIKRLHFPASLILRGNLPLVTYLGGKAFTNSNLREAQFQRRLILIVCGMFHIPIAIGPFSSYVPYDLFLILYTVTFLLISPIIIIFCMRFGHQLLTDPNSE